MTTSIVPTVPDLSRSDRHHDRHLPELERAERADRDFMAALGVVCDSPGTVASPMRMAEACAELLTPREFFAVLSR